MKQIKGKLKSSLGMSLGEMLCAVLILVLVSGLMASAVSLAVRQFQRSMRESEAEILCSTIETILGNELAYTTEIRIDNSGNVTQFLSQNFTMEDNLSTLMTDGVNHAGYGQILLGNSDNVDESMNILGKGAYTNGLLAKIDKFTYDNINCCFRVKLSVGFNGQAYATRDFQVMNVNQTYATSAH